MKDHKDHLLVVGMCLAMLAIAVMVLAYQPHRALAPQTIFAVLDQGQQSPVTTRANYLITNESEYGQLWTMLHGAGTIAPAVDFSREQVIAVFAGREPSAGYSIAVTGVFDESGARVVRISLAEPDPSCAVGSSTAPYEIVALSATNLLLTHADDIVNLPCG